MKTKGKLEGRYPIWICCAPDGARKEDGNLGLSDALVLSERACHDRVHAPHHGEVGTRERERGLVGRSGDPE